MNEPKTILERRRFLTDVGRQLNLLEKDLILQNDKYKLLHVVDFSAIFAYIYKTFDQTSIPSVGSEPAPRKFARQQVALELMFSGSERPVLLIPPYASELRNHLDVVKLQVRLVDLGIRDSYRDKLTQLVLRSPEFQRFVEVRGRNIDDAAKSKAALDVGKEYFPELYTLLMCAITGGLATLKQMFGDGVLLDAGSAIPEMSDFSYESMESRITPWYERISKLRNRKRAFQTLTDAMACAYIEVANERTNPDKRIVIFVSPSSHVRTVMEGSKLVRSKSVEDITAVRELEYFLLHFTHKGDIRRVRETIRTTRELLHLYGSLRGQDSEIAGRSKQLLLQSEPMWQRAENHFLLGDSDLIRKEELTGQIPIDQVFLSLIEKLHNAAARDTDSLNQEGERLLGELREAVIELDRMVPADKTAATLKGLRIQEVRDSFLVTFPPLPDELSLNIQVFDRSLAAISERLSKLATSGSSQEVVWIRDDIMSLASGQDAGPEHCLLSAYVLAMESKLDAALAEVDRGIALQTAGAKKELFYLEAVISRRLLNAKRAQSAMEKALSIEGDDPRFCLELGRALWLKEQFDTAVGAFPPNVELLERAITVTEKAWRLTADSRLGADFSSQVHNSLAFFYAERSILRGKCADIEAAEAHVRQMRELVPEEKWISKFHDTVAWVEYSRATFIGSVQARDLLLGAKARVQKAREKESFASGRTRLLKLHEERIDELLKAS